MTSISDLKKGLQRIRVHLPDPPKKPKKRSRKRSPKFNPTDWYYKYFGKED